MSLAAFDMFCGIGGLSEGLRLAGFDVVGAIDCDPLALSSYESNHDQARVWEGDIRDSDPSTILDELGLEPGELDLLAGCPPCQGYSSMRTHNGGRPVSDAQNELVFEFGRFAVAMRPRALMMENVPALATDERMVRLRAKLRELGYGLHDDVLNAVEYGVPQRRRRYILLGLLEGRPAFGEEASHRRTVADAIRELPPHGSGTDQLHVSRERRSPEVRSRIAAIPRDGGSRSDLDPSTQLKCHRDSDGWRDVYGRMAWDRPSPTITGGCVNPSKGRFLHPDENRAITLREAALLQSFRGDYIVDTSRGKFAAAQMIGNALPPDFVAAHARSLKTSLERA